MKFKVIEKNIPMRPDAPKKQYAIPINAGRMTLKDFAREIAGRSSLTRGDIENVLSNFLDELPTFLKIGMSVQLGDFGTLRLNLQSEGVEQGQKFDSSKIKGVKVIFTPGAALKKELADTSFEEVHEQTVTAPGNGNNNGGRNGGVVPPR
ncbi:MAG: HU family DNA-binding protein [Bacteroidales bacterium]|jgi:predicted histone-like DNA-binding protein|nr:HU family DNA-binding protein [Bacteroidales bacterium]